MAAVEPTSGSGWQRYSVKLQWENKLFVLVRKGNDLTRLALELFQFDHFFPAETRGGKIHRAREMARQIILITPHGFTEGMLQAKKEKERGAN